MLKWLCALGGVGFLPCPGTMASLLVVLIIYYVGGVGFGGALIVAVISWFVVWLYTRTSAISGDPSYVVLDEVAGQALALAGHGRAVWVFCVGFFVFRILDITKPGCIGRLDSKTGASGIMLDDVAAGLSTWCVLAFLCWMMRAC